MRGVRGREEAAVYVFAQPVLSHPLPLARLDLGLRQAALHCLEAPVGLDRFHLGRDRELQQVAPPSDIRVLISARASGSLGVGSTNATFFFFFFSFDFASNACSFDFFTRLATILQS